MLENTRMHSIQNPLMSHVLSFELIGTFEVHTLKSMPEQEAAHHQPQWATKRTRRFAPKMSPHFTASGSKESACLKSSTESVNTRRHLSIMFLPNDGEETTITAL